MLHNIIAEFEYSGTKPAKPLTGVQVWWGCLNPNLHPYLYEPVSSTCVGLQTRDIPYKAMKLGFITEGERKVGNST